MGDKTRTVSAIDFEGPLSIEGQAIAEVARHLLECVIPEDREALARAAEDVRALKRTIKFHRGELEDLAERFRAAEGRTGTGIKINPGMLTTGTIAAGDLHLYGSGSSSFARQ